MNARMRRMRHAAIFLVGATAAALYTNWPVFFERQARYKENSRRGILLEELTWPEAGRALAAYDVVVIPLAHSAKAHGPHLPLNTDLVIIEGIRRMLVERVNVLVGKTITDGACAGLSYFPGSVCVDLKTTWEIVVQECRAYARENGPRRFYILSESIAVTVALDKARMILRNDGIALHYLHPDTLIPGVGLVSEERVGTHANEVETSLMLFFAPHLVRMDLARKDERPWFAWVLQDPAVIGERSLSGVYGDPTLATETKGWKFAEALVAADIAEIEKLRKAPLP
jgi:creatinine amidohydrolase